MEICTTPCSECKHLSERPIYRDYYPDGTFRWRVCFKRTQDYVVQCPDFDRRTEPDPPYPYEGWTREQLDAERKRIEYKLRRLDNEDLFVKKPDGFDRK